MSHPLLFDTCVVEQYLHPRAEQKWPGMRARIERAMGEAGGLYISAVTAFEIRRHLEVLARTGEGRSKIRRTELFLRDAMIIEPGDRAGHSWRVAARLYADGKLHRPAIQLSDGDLLIRGHRDSSRASPDDHGSASLGKSAGARLRRVGNVPCALIAAMGGIGRRL